MVDLIKPAREFGSSPPAVSPAPEAQPPAGDFPPVENLQDGASASAETEASPPSIGETIEEEMNERAAEEKQRKQREREYWANQRAQGKAAFVKYDSGNGIPFSRGKPLMSCLLCEALLMGEKAINQHAKRCRKR